MESEILKLVYDYSTKMQIVDIKYIEKLVEIVTRSKSLNNYVKNILWNNQLMETSNGVTVAIYDPQYKNIAINILSLKIVLANFLAHNRLFNNVERFFYSNLMLTQIILHELEHANQKKMLDQKGNDLEIKLLSACLDINLELKDPELWIRILNGAVSEVDVKKFYDKQKALYKKYYKYNPCERLAQIKTYKIIVRIVDQIKNLTPSLQEFERALLMEEMLRGYKLVRNKVECPSQVFLLGIGLDRVWNQFDFYDSNTRKMEEKVSLKYSLEKRLTYGLPISSTEHYQLEKRLESTNKYK